MRGRWASVRWLLTAACSYLGAGRDFDPAELDRGPGWLAVREVQLVRQKEEADCGAAAASMVLGRWGIQTTSDQIRSACPKGPQGGIRAGDLREYIRGRGLQAFLVHGEFKDLHNELSKGRPVIIGLYKPYITGVWAHYEVVTALHAEKRIVVTLDPDRGWRQYDMDGLMSEWDPSGRLTLVVIKPEGSK